MTRSWLVPAALLAMIAGPAVAADMPVKALPPPAPVASGWNGFYIGAQVGFERQTADWNPTCIDAGGPPLGTCGSALSLIFFPGGPDSAASFKGSGTRYGIYDGWMFQATDRLVLGFEGDYAFHSKTATVPFIVGCATAACGGPFGPTAPPFTGDSTSIKLGDDYSMRVRAGFLVLPELQIYATGGAAAQHVSATLVCGITGAAGCGFPITTFSEKTLVGYTVGAGIEWKVWDHILLRGEYRYNDYGTWKQSGFINSGQIEEFANVHVKSQMATFGIAYLFPPPKW
jgi:outer membrane immunogenic protein